MVCLDKAHLAPFIMVRAECTHYLAAFRAAHDLIASTSLHFVRAWHSRPCILGTT